MLDWRLLVRTPTAATGLAIAVIFAIACSAFVILARESTLIAPGRVMNDTALVRRAFSIDDREATDKARELARQQTPRVYTADQRVIESIGTSIANLPATVAGVTTPEEIAPEIARQFRLTEDAIAQLHDQLVDGDVRAEWREAAWRLARSIVIRPLVDDRALQRELQEGLSARVELRIPGEDGGGVETAIVHRDTLISTSDADKLRGSMTLAARQAGFDGPVLPTIVSRLTATPVPTFRFDESATIERQTERAGEVRPLKRDVPVGQVIFRRGDVLTTAQLDLFREEQLVFQREAESWRVWLRRGSLAGAVAAVTLAICGYVVLFGRRIALNTGRQAGLAALLAGSLGVASIASIVSPGLVAMTATAPPVFAATILVLAYDQRVALALASLLAVMTCMALDQPIGMLALSVTGIGTAVWRLRELRERRGFVNMSAATGAALGLGMLVVGLIDRPISRESLIQTLGDAAWAGVGGLLCGGLTLFILPTIERTFGITTGLTLVELRDPRQPLLRRLQQLAPGTYTHSLNVASLAEAAADAIGANSLLAYAGALYHDVGKMNKPDYFVENQTGGINRHEKLTPAMSLLVIVGHVKDGIELAREFGLPRPLHHFIEAHHGTTLVEYFYHRARRQAASQRDDGASGPEEFEFRYPGPRPRTREVAIVMICDAAESAARSIGEPSASRIDALVRAIAHKRLTDGQFDEADLTLRDLSTIVDTVSKTLASIYHGRVAYPTDAAPADDEARTGDIARLAAGPADGPHTGGGTDEPRTAPGAATRRPA